VQPDFVTLMWLAHCSTQSKKTTAGKASLMFFRFAMVLRALFRTRFRLRLQLKQRCEGFTPLFGTDVILIYSRVLLVYT
jgi:hypothetical protein